MNGLDYFFLIGDFTVALACIGFVLAYRKKRYPILLYHVLDRMPDRLTWEFTFLYLGPEFVHSVKEWP
ncbi:hypothetical protein Ct9H90mP29_14020 [bacterium]|nr:MAG: hypothetical protein Ct9H90mP29_14020 [bacterium]